MATKWGTVACDPPVPMDPLETAWRRELIRCGPVVCIRKIDDLSLEEYLFRARFVQRVLDPSMFRVKWRQRGRDVQLNLTPAILRRWSGMWVECQEVGNRSDWLDYILRGASKSVSDEVRQELLAEEVA